jgi:hypothetical protein
MKPGPTIQIHSYQHQTFRCGKTRIVISEGTLQENTQSEIRLARGTSLFRGSPLVTLPLSLYIYLIKLKNLKSLKL